MALFRIILLFLFIYVLFRLVTRLFLSVYRQRHSSSDPRYQDSSRRRKEGEVTIDYKSEGKQKKVGKDEGEYIRYEEINDEDDDN
jgi:hypothetical protein